jgi:hypothetical protein
MNCTVRSVARTNTRARTWLDEWIGRRNETYIERPDCSPSPPIPSSIIIARAQTPPPARRPGAPAVAMGAMVATMGARAADP